MTADARASSTPDDPFLWLEEIHGDRALAWVRAENERTLGRSPDEARAQLTGELLEVLESDERIPYVARHGEHLYNLWRDADHVQVGVRRLVGLVDELLVVEPVDQVLDERERGGRVLAVLAAAPLGPVRDRKSVV